MFTPDFLKKENIIARPGFNRWLVPPAALAIHLCIGMAYGFSVFWLPLSRAIGITAPVAAPAGLGFFARVFSTAYDWDISMLGWMFTLFFVFLGSSAAVWGKWLEKAGPRKAGLVSAFCWSGGLVISAIGVSVHQIWLLWLGSGVIGGIGLGLGYISPVSTLIKWFPDKRGMATGLAIMGFGGGAMIGAPLADTLMNAFASATEVGVWQTFLALAGVYFVYMAAGALSYRIPPADWRPEGWTPPAADPARTMITHNQVHVRKAWKTPQFWLVWGVLCLNVSAGIGVLGMASPLLQEVFGGKLLGLDLSFAELGEAHKARVAAVAAGFTGLLSLFNIGGRFFWASLSDVIGRKRTFAVFFVLGIALYALAPVFGRAGSLLLFAGTFCVIVSMYGGGFAAVPAYLADLFGTQMVGAIHGRLLTAWATAGVLGPVLVNYLREFQIARGVPRAQAYDATMYILAGLLALGFVCNLLVRPVKAKNHMSDAEVEAVKVVGKKDDATPTAKTDAPAGIGSGGNPLKLILAWAAVGVPLAFGVWNTVLKAIALFR